MYVHVTNECSYTLRQTQIHGFRDLISWVGVENGLRNRVFWTPLSGSSLECGSLVLVVVWVCTYGGACPCYAPLDRVHATSIWIHPPPSVGG